VLILPYLPYFALGVLLYLYFVRHSFRWSVEGLLGAVALVAIGLIDSPTRLVWACGFLCLFPLVVFRWPSSFVVRVLARVGLVSYPFYLVHETIGWAVIQGLEARGAGANEAIAIAFGVALALACLVHAVVERPATRWVRRVWNQSGSHERGAMGNGRAKWIAGTLLVGIAILIGNRLTLNG
jgi:peptidoglycan/LPS O-acetylase OafA/YrhL